VEQGKNFPIAFSWVWDGEGEEVAEVFGVLVAIFASIRKA
jgi:hypothetical protein